MFKNNIKLLYFITKIANQDDHNAYIKNSPNEIALPFSLTHVYISSLNSYTVAH